MARLWNKGTENLGCRCIETAARCPELDKGNKGVAIIGRRCDGCGKYVLESVPIYIARFKCVGDVERIWAQKNPRLRVFLRSKCCSCTCDTSRHISSHPPLFISLVHMLEPFFDTIACVVRPSRNWHHDLADRSSVGGLTYPPNILLPCCGEGVYSGPG